MTEDFGRIERLLGDQRPRLTALEEDELKSRVRSRATKPAAVPRYGGIMRTRLAITATLAIGILMSGTGVGLAVSGISGSGSAGTAQYPQELAPGETPKGDVLGEQPTGGGPEDDADVTPEEVQPPQQAAAPDDEGLPFTGLAAIPLLLGGIALVGFGVVLRRGARSEPAH